MSLHETVFAVPKMDCPSEERMIRTALDGLPDVQGIACDLGARRVRIVHRGDAQDIEARLAPLGLGASVVETVAAHDASIPAPVDPAREARVLWTLLAINAAMFVVEIGAAWFAGSAGLLADSLDMFADAAVYGLALLAVGRSARAKLRTAHTAGWIQALLALGALAEVVRRAFAGGDPEPPLMMAVASVALVANSFCLWLVSRHREGGAHMKASVIFSANDVLANLGVVVAGVLVMVTGSQYPDLAIGAVIAVVVLLGARRILRLR
ncbi:MAG TPA: cation transporter [Kofleriaceae bacterium]|nr:cation transporter [Kofleriaceae bacterium]